MVAQALGSLLIEKATWIEFQASEFSLVEPQSQLLQILGGVNQWEELHYLSVSFKKVKIILLICDFV